MAPSKSITNDVYFTPIGRNQFSIKLVRAHFHMYIIVVRFLVLVTTMVTKVDHGNHRSNDRGNHHSNHRGYYHGYYDDNT